MFRGKGWFSGNLWKPKNPHSIEHLKYLHHLFSKNQVVTEQNKALLVETLRSIAEILIWGDQNDSTVFDFFLEKNMLSFFLQIMKQKCGRYVCVQLLQTLNILFENIRNETSLYYLLSNNHINSIIVHKFDFSDEEVMAYYISFLKTLSLKLNTHTINFFYNEHTNDFPLYTEAIKFFNHSESMVCIAVRTITLNIFKVQDKAMLKFIRDKTAAPYFSNLAWFIGSHVLELDICVRMEPEHQSRLPGFVAEHLDHLHYLNDILCLQIDDLNDVLTDHFLNRLLVPLYVYSLINRGQHSQIEDDRPCVSSVVSLFLLSQVFLIISHRPLVRQLAYIIFNKDMKIFSSKLRDQMMACGGDTSTEPEFVAPQEALENLLENEKSAKTTIIKESSSVSLDDQTVEATEEEVMSHHFLSECSGNNDSKNKDDKCLEEQAGQFGQFSSFQSDETNITDEEKVEVTQRLGQCTLEQIHQEFSLEDRPFLEAIFNALECTENDHNALFALCLFYALGHNAGINQDLLDTVLMPTNKSETKHLYNIHLVERLIKIISQSCQYNSCIRLVTLEMSVLLLKQLVLENGCSFLQDHHLEAIDQAREESTLLLRNFYKSEEIFLDMFENEYQEMKKRPLNVEYLMMDDHLLLPPTDTPLSGIEFHKRLPCGEVERARQTIRVFFILRDLTLSLGEETETQLPLTNLNNCVKINEVLDLNNSDLIACTVLLKDGQKVRRFMVIDILQVILVHPDTKRLGWGIVKFVGFLQCVEVVGDKDDSRCLHLTVHHPASSTGAAGRNGQTPLLAAKFVFDDHIRCMAAKQRLTKGRLKSRQRKLQQIAKLLELPDYTQPYLRSGLQMMYDKEHLSAIQRSQSQDMGFCSKTSSPCGGQGPYRPLFTSMNRVPGFATMIKREQCSTSNSNHCEPGMVERQRRQSGSPSANRRNHSVSGSKQSSLRLKQNSSFEEILLDDISKSWSRHSSPNLRRQSVSGLPKARISAPPNLSYVSSCTGISSHSFSGRLTASSEDSEGLDKKSAIELGYNNSSEECITPKTLRPAETPPTSLITGPECEESISYTVPHLLPPSSSQLYHISDAVLQNGLYNDVNPESPSSPCIKPCCMNEATFAEKQLTRANEEKSQELSKTSARTHSPTSNISGGLGELSSLEQISLNTGKIDCLVRDSKHVGSVDMIPELALSVSPDGNERQVVGKSDTTESGNKLIKLQVKVLCSQCRDYYMFQRTFLHLSANINKCCCWVRDVSSM
ncbi:protein CLEC16A-like isoform X2 [Tachypleus tridentatus]|uniref:protein CLEC16A-like isoform X2 n=1 Tax=Tachypleus tridentatus TaxID=6853 RepID=UPI003FD4D0D2